MTKQDQDQDQDYRGRITDVATLRRFIFAGNATITIRSPATGVRFTYKVKQAHEDDGSPKDFWFCSLFTGEDNENDFQYFGHFYYGHKYQGRRPLVYSHGRKSRISDGAVSMVAWGYFVQVLLAADDSPRAAQRQLDKVEVWHEGRCGRCGRKLTVPESISSGFGPECINHV